MSTASTTKPGTEVSLLRPDLGPRTFTLPEGATLADLLREAGGGIQAKNILIDGRPLEEFVILNSGMAVTVVPEPRPSPAKRSWRDIVSVFADDPDFQAMVDAARAQRKAEKKTIFEKSDPDFPLAEEVATYEAHLPGWADREGEFVLIKGRDVLGFYHGLEAALDAGYEQLGGAPFLAKQILAVEPIYNLNRIEF